MSHLTAATGSNIGPLKGLSRMRGNSHVRFLGEPRSVMALAYPTTPRRMVDSAALLVDEILPHQPMRQWVLTVPFPLRFLFASQPAVMGKVLGIVYRAIATHLTRKAGFTKVTARTGAVTLIQCFGGALNAHIPQGTLS
jgi:hypothetical protein